MTENSTEARPKRVLHIGKYFPPHRGGMKDPILVVDSEDPLNAQKLPLLLLPRPAVQVMQIDIDLMAAWKGVTVLLGTEDEALDRAVSHFASRQSPKK